MLDTCVVMYLWNGDTIDVMLTMFGWPKKNQNCHPNSSYIYTNSKNTWLHRYQASYSSKLLMNQHVTSIWYTFSAYMHPYSISAQKWPQKLKKMTFKIWFQQWLHYSYLHSNNCTRYLYSPYYTFGIHLVCKCSAMALTSPRIPPYSLRVLIAPKKSDSGRNQKNLK